MAADHQDQDPSEEHLLVVAHPWGGMQVCWLPGWGGEAWKGRSGGSWVSPSRLSCLTPSLRSSLGHPWCGARPPSW